MDAVSLCSTILDHLKALRVRIDKFKRHPDDFRALVDTHDRISAKLQQLTSEAHPNSTTESDLQAVQLHVSLAFNDLESVDPYLQNASAAAAAASSSQQPSHTANRWGSAYFKAFRELPNLLSNRRTLQRTNRIDEALTSAQTNLKSAWDIVHEIRLVRIEQGVNELHKSANIVASNKQYAQTAFKQFVPLQCPTDVHFGDVSHSALTVKWERPLGEEKKIVAFEVSCRKKVAAANYARHELLAKPITRIVPVSCTSCRIESLEPATWYIVKVRSQCPGGWGEWSAEIEVQTTHPLREEYNLLLLGETGVGKSTFINAFIQYLCYETLNDAKEGGLIPVIPTAFTVTINGEQMTVTVGDEKGSGESISTALSGQSCTQSPRSYVITIKGQGQHQSLSCRIQLIDTPGIGDTRGTGYDKENLRNVLHYIDNFDELHGILVLMKPNDSRLTIAMKYCIKELLRHLHKSAANILMFVFTNARSTFYEPGDTLTPLRKILRDIKDSNKVDIKANRETMFCVDSESFRYLAARMNGISFHSARDADFRDSWEKSSATCRKIFQRIKTLEPHEVKETTTLNEIRNNIIMMSRPLVLISDTIRRNLKRIENDRKEINDVRGEIEVLKKRQFEEFVELQPKTMEKPRTVCTHEGCTRVEMVSGSHMKVPKNSCHEPCYLENVPVKVIGDAALARCAAMEFNQGFDSAICGCGHSFKLHMHEAVKYVQVTKKRVNESTNRMILTKSGDIKGKESMISALEREKKEWEEEEAVVLKTMAKFAHFLNHNGILSINDAMEDYIMYQIREQEDIRAYMGPGQSNQAAIDGLKENLKRYQAEKAILEDAFQKQKVGNVEHGSTSKVDNDGGVVGLKGAKNAMKELMNLPHVGASVQNAMNAERKAIREQISLQQFMVPLPWDNRNNSNALRWRPTLHRGASASTRSHNRWGFDQRWAFGWF